MRAINHTVAGAVIGAVVTNPVLALPAALVSHLVMDALPHHGDEDHKSWKFKIGLIADGAASLAIVLAIFLLKPDHWLLMIACASLATAPDFLWLPHWVLELRGKPREFGPILRFLAWIQWCERPWGIYIEAVWLAATLYLFFRVTA